MSQKRERVSDGAEGPMTNLPGRVALWLVPRLSAGHSHSLHLGWIQAFCSTPRRRPGWPWVHVSSTSTPSSPHVPRSFLGPYVGSSARYTVRPIPYLDHVVPYTTYMYWYPSCSQKKMYCTLLSPTYLPTCSYMA